MANLINTVLFLSIICLIPQRIQCSKKKKNDKMCEVCRVVVSEANWAIGQVDPNKSITGGSFRVDPLGNQPYKKEKKYARSETHLEDIFEKVCDKFNYYAVLTKDDGSEHVVRTETFDHTLLEVKDLNVDREAGRQLKYRCGDLLEDHIDDIISGLQEEDVSDYEVAICGRQTGVCSMEALSVPMETLPPVVEEEDKDPLEGRASAGLDEDFKTLENEDKEEKEEL